MSRTYANDIGKEITNRKTGEVGIVIGYRADKHFKNRGYYVVDWDSHYRQGPDSDKYVDVAGVGGIYSLKEIHEKGINPPWGKGMVGWRVYDPGEGAKGVIHQVTHTDTPGKEIYWVDWYDMGDAQWSPEDIEDFDQEELTYGEWELLPPERAVDESSAGLPSDFYQGNTRQVRVKRGQMWEPNPETYRYSFPPKDQKVFILSPFGAPRIMTEKGKIVLANSRKRFYENFRFVADNDETRRMFNHLIALKKKQYGPTFPHFYNDFKDDRPVVDESSAGLPRDFYKTADPLVVGRVYQRKEMDDIDRDAYELLGYPEQARTRDIRKNMVVFTEPDGSNQRTVSRRSFEDLYDIGVGLGESYRAGEAGAYIDPEMGDQGQVQDLAPMIIDLGSSRRGDIDESFLRMFGSGIQAIMRRMFGGPVVPVTVRGTRSQIDSFSKVLQREKKYMETWQELGLDNPATYKSKYKLDSAVRQFERKTGLKYPFK